MMGKNVFGFKMQSFIFGAMIMGIGGALYAHFNKTISPDKLPESINKFLDALMYLN